MQNAMLDIKLLNAELELDESKLIVCPFCQEDWEAAGYPTHWHPERSLKATRVQEGVVYICYRAGCGKSGIVAGEYLLPSGTKPKAKFTPRQFKGDLELLPHSVWQSTLAKYDLPLDVYQQQGVRYAPAERRIYYPLYNIYGYQFGETLKSVVNAKPKSLHYVWSDTVPVVHFPLFQVPSTTLVLVEDIVSATKIAQFQYCAAILGTHLPADTVLYFKKMGIEGLIIFLDNDAISKALGMINKYQGVMNMGLALCHDGMDPKDYSFRRLEEMLCL